MPNWRSRGGSIEVGWNDYESLEKQQPDRSSIESKGSDPHRMKFQRNSPSSTHVKKSRGKRDGSGSGTTTPGGTGRPISDNRETFSSISTTSMEQDQRVMQSKGNQKLNAELKEKANELEKLLAVHKLRVPRNQGRKSIQAEEREASLASKDSLVDFFAPSAASAEMVPEPSHSSYKKKSIATESLTKQVFDDTPKQNMDGLGCLDQRLGSLYDQYTQKRDSKLKEEWSLRRAEKEARMKVLQDSVERSRSEMKSKLVGLTDRKGSHKPVKKLIRSFTSPAQENQPTHLSDDDEDQAEFGQGNLTSGTRMADGAPKGKKAILNNNVVSSTPPVERVASSNSAKASGSSAGRKKVQAENPHAQPVPTFSEFRKESMKQPTTASKESMKQSTTASKGRRRPQVRNYNLSKSSNDYVLSFEEKPRHHQHSRKSSANSLVSKDFSSRSFDGVEHEDEFSKSTAAGKFSRKGIALGVPRSKASVATKTFVNDGERFKNTAKEQDLESAAHMDNGRPRGSRGSVKSLNFWCENGDALGVPSQSNYSTMAEIPASLPSAFCSMVAALNSPGESPGSWHSHLHKLHSVKHDISGFDSFMDSPIGTPAYWNTNDSDAARMKKYAVSGSSHSPSRKDVTKGLKRFLKFGKKDRVTDTVADWISATTSEGGDTEDGKYPTSNKSSEGLRKSRMGFLHNRNDDGFSEADSFSEQVHGFSTPPLHFKLMEDHQFGSSALKAPKSCFSFSPFRSKGGDSKPR